MADLNGDGLLDIFVTNTFDWKSKEALLAEPWALNEYNQLFLNMGGNRFKDVSAAAGISIIAPSFTWPCTAPRLSSSARSSSFNFSANAGR